ncbi:hypothetical protein M5K25_005909 [Dendrobium thyrsiflorum]|uniref:Uncharacterized protein n=1 Tax=Dendrobium thyrsiflorum TaxID=117978 RepID=A0ABD0VH48_DENTH
MENGEIESADEEMASRGGRRYTRVVSHEQAVIQMSPIEIISPSGILPNCLYDLKCLFGCLANTEEKVLLVLLLQAALLMTDFRIVLWTEQDKNDYFPTIAAWKELLPPIIIYCAG